MSCRNQQTYSIPSILTPEDLRVRVQPTVSLQVDIADIINLSDSDLPAGTSPGRLNVHSTVVC